MRLHCGSVSTSRTLFPSTESAALRALSLSGQRGAQSDFADENAEQYGGFEVAEAAYDEAMAARTNAADVDYHPAADDSMSDSEG